MKSLSYRFHLIFSGAWRRRYMIIVPIAILPIIGLCVGLGSPKQYSSHTSMLIQETAKMNPFLADFAVSSMLNERMDALQTLLHSRHILGTVAKDIELVSKSTPAIEVDSIIAKLSSSLSVSLSGKDLIRINHTSTSPLKMRETLKSVSKIFLDQLLAPERSSIRDSDRFLKQHLQERRVELETSEASLARFKSDNATELPELHLSNITRLTQLKQRLSERLSELAGAKKSLGGLDRQLSKTNPVVGTIEEKIISIRGDLALLRARYTDNHSLIKGALRNLRRLEHERQNILSKPTQSFDAEKLWDIASSASISKDNHQPLLISQLDNLQRARSKVIALGEETKALTKMISELEKRTRNYGANEQKLLKLERDLKVKGEFYNDLLQRHEMARVTGSLGVFEQEKRVKVIDRPFTPTSPSNLPITYFVVAGLLGGLLLGCGMALLLEITDSTIRTREQIETLLGVPVLSRIPPLLSVTGELV